MIQTAPQPADATALAEVGAVLASTALPLAPLAVVLLRRLFPGRNVFFARWGFSHVLGIGAVAVVLSAALPVATPDLSGISPSSRVVLELALRTGVLGVCCLGVALVARRVDPSGIRCLGLWQGRNARAVASGFAAYAMVLPGIVGLGLVAPWLLREVGLEAEPSALQEALRELAPADRPLAVLLGVGVAPLLEEVLFRAFLQPLLVQNLSERAGIAATSLVFAALHGVGAFLPVLALSLLLGAVMLRTQRLLAVWSVHAVHNALVFLLLYAGSSPG